ncbi:hypothetical protein V1478_004513 [Vespula squamosa]|uniref:Uncharacterized protein n=1 Tax=Vespula squamosa TaxID=30214 RepID=A0ABD2BGE4_VESSQ
MFFDMVYSRKHLFSHNEIPSLIPKSLPIHSVRKKKIPNSRKRGPTGIIRGFNVTNDRGAMHIQPEHSYWNKLEGEEGDGDEGGGAGGRGGDGGETFSLCARQSSTSSSNTSTTKPLAEHLGVRRRTAGGSIGWLCEGYLRTSRRSREVGQNERGTFAVEREITSTIASVDKSLLTLMSNVDHQRRNPSHAAAFSTSKNLRLKRTSASNRLLCLLRDPVATYPLGTL